MDIQFYRWEVVCVLGAEAVTSALVVRSLVATGPIEIPKSAGNMQNRGDKASWLVSHTVLSPLVWHGRGRLLGREAERLAFKFRFVDDSGKKFIGPVFVAKESRFTEDLNDDNSSTNYDYLRSHRHYYHKSFLRTQATSQRFAKMFNATLETFHQLKEVSYPTISFVDPLVFELEDTTKARTYNVLVEPMITGKYQKFTTNFGNLGPELKRDFSVENEGVNLEEAAILLGRDSPNLEQHHSHNTGATQKPTSGANPANLGIIEEGSEDDDEESSGDYESEPESDNSSLSNSEPMIDISCVRDTDYLETFSHFTYVRSGGKLMVSAVGCTQLSSRLHLTKTLIL